MAQQGMTLIVILGALAMSVLPIGAQTSQTKYPNMAPVDQYLMADRNNEIALARSAAPQSITDKAEVRVLGKNGFDVAIRGTNDFVCFVERSWDAAIGDPNFWNPNIRGPVCLNAAAARSYLPIVMMKTRLAIAGMSQNQIDEAVRSAFKDKKLLQMEQGAIGYMLSKNGYLDDQAKNWRPHVMFFVPLALRDSWGANLPGSPIFSGDDSSDQLTIFMVPVAQWSDGSLDVKAGK